MNEQDHLHLVSLVKCNLDMQKFLIKLQLD